MDENKEKEELNDELLEQVSGGNVFTDPPINWKNFFRWLLKWKRTRISRDSATIFWIRLSAERAAQENGSRKQTGRAGQLSVCRSPVRRIASA